MPPFRKPLPQGGAFCFGLSLRALHNIRKKRENSSFCEKTRGDAGRRPLTPLLSLEERSKEEPAVKPAENLLRKLSAFSATMLFKSKPTVSSCERNRKHIDALLFAENGVFGRPKFWGFQGGFFQKAPIGGVRGNAPRSPPTSCQTVPPSPRRRRGLR